MMRWRLAAVAATCLVGATACGPPGTAAPFDPSTCARTVTTVFQHVGRSASNQRVSGDGRFVVFQVDDGTGPTIPIMYGAFSDSYNLNIYDLQTGVTTPINAPGTTALDASVSGDGRYVAYREATRDANYALRFGVDVWDRSTGITTRITSMSANVWGPSVSDDGRYVAFASDATDLVAGDPDVNANADLFVWDRVSGATTRLTDQSVNFFVVDVLFGPRSVRISGDGSTILLARVVAPDSSQIVSVNRVTGVATTLLNQQSFPGPNGPVQPWAMLGSVSADGQVLTYATAAPGSVDDQNFTWDVFRRGPAGTTQLTRPQTGPPGTQNQSFAVFVDSTGRWTGFVTSLVDPTDTVTSPPATLTYGSTWIVDSVTGVYRNLGPYGVTAASASGAVLVGGTGAGDVFVSRC